MSKLNKAETKKVLLAAKKLMEVELLISSIGVDIYIDSENINFVKGELFNDDLNNSPIYENIVHSIPFLWGGGGLS